ncbi:MAG: glutamyl-tRNA reductase [Crocinitomicaceae bacterium]
MQRINIIAFTHAAIGLDELGSFHLEEQDIRPKMEALKSALDLKEIMYLSTCNRVEFLFVTDQEVNQIFIINFLQSFYKDRSSSPNIEELSTKARYWSGINAVNHLIEVATSLDSVVLGEREIITQVRNAYEFARKEELAGDTIRIVIRQTIETAKKVYTQTSISEKSVSVVSLAFHELMKVLPVDPGKTKVAIVGSGVTNQNMSKFLTKNGFTSFSVFNRTLANAEKLAEQIGGSAFALNELTKVKEKFDVLITCTSSSKPIIDEAFLSKQNQLKVIVDLAIPADVDHEVLKNYSLEYISVNTVKTLSEKNLLIRKKELLKARQIIFEALEEFKEIFEMRQMEIRMRSIPKHVKAIRNRATSEVFSSEIETLDDNAKDVLDKVLNYMEKKYVSVPMIMAKEMLSKNH